jgi:hypothetical protein
MGRANSEKEEKMKRWSAMAKAFTNWKDIVMAVKKVDQILIIRD